MTSRQMMAIKDVFENKMPVSKAMLKNGYAPNSAKNPQNLTNSDAFREIVKQQLPINDFFKAHRNALQATKHVLLDDGNMVTEADHNIRLKSVDMAYKTHGLYGNMDNRGNTNTQINITLDGSGYIPPNNVLGLKPTKFPKRIKD